MLFFLTWLRWMNGRCILQDLNYTFKVIVVCVLNCKWYPQFNSAPNSQYSTAPKTTKLCDIQMMNIFLHFLRVPAMKICGWKETFLYHVKFNSCLCLCLSPWAVCICDNEMRLWKWKITHIDELYHQTNISCFCFCSSFSAILLFIHSSIWRDSYPAFCSIYKHKKRSRVKTLFLISIVNFSRHPRSSFLWKFSSSKGRNEKK